MSRLSRLAKSAFAALALLTLSAPAVMAQATPNAAILVVDFERLIGESLAGKDASAQISDYVAKVNARGQQLSEQLKSEGENLVKQRSILKEADFQRRAREYAQKEQSANQELERKRVSAQRAAQQARTEILRLARPIVRKIMQKRKANFVVPKENAGGPVLFDFKESLDITSDVLERLNRENPKMNVALPES